VACVVAVGSAFDYITEPRHDRRHPIMVHQHVSDFFRFRGLASIESMVEFLIGILIAIAVLLACLLLCAVYYRFTTRYTWPQIVLAMINWFYVRLIWRTTIEGRLPDLGDKGMVIICNHSSGVDPMFLQATMKRVVHWMVAREYTDLKSLGWFFRIVEAIRVNRRGVDTAATKAAIRLCEQGEPVGMFPEGRINNTDELLLPGRPGAALIALRAKVPVVPCYVRGAPYDGNEFRSMWTFARAHLTIGEPLDISEEIAAYHADHVSKEVEREVLNALTLRFLREIAKLAGEPDYEPRLAGRKWMPDGKGETPASTDDAATSDQPS